jgi:sodium transport system ATP-binding protein
MIVIKDLTKIYKLTKKQMQEQRTKKNMKKAVNHLSLTAKPGEIYGLLGPNGAGKTTALRCVATLLKPTEGSISVCGLDTVKDSEKVRERISFLTNEIKLDPQFSPKYMFNFFGRLHGQSEQMINSRREKLF